MKIYNKIVYDFDNNIIEEDYYEYNGPLTLAGPSGAGAGSSDAPNTSRSTLSSKNQAKADKKSRSTASTGTSNVGGIGTGDGGGAPDAFVKIAKLDLAAAKMAPTTAEVSQSTTTEADADTEANRLLKIKKRGRSASIMTGSQGVTKTSTDYSLGKKSLLGRV